MDEGGYIMDEDDVYAYGPDPEIITVMSKEIANNRQLHDFFTELRFVFCFFFLVGYFGG